MTDEQVSKAEEVAEGQPNALPNTQPGWDAGGNEGNFLHADVNPFILTKERVTGVPADPHQDQATRELGGRIVRWRESLLNTIKKRP